MSTKYSENIIDNTHYPDFKDHILKFMGDCLIEIELEDTHIAAAFHRAKKVHEEQGNVNYDRRFLSFPVKKNKTEYEIPKNVEVVIDIIQSKGGLHVGDPFHIAYINQIFGHKVSGFGDLLIFDLSLQQQEIIKKYSAYHRQWIHNRDKNTITLLKEPLVDETWFIEVQITKTDEQYMDMLWIQRYTIAELKGIIGRAYRKFSTLSTPSGDVSLDGDQLVQESREEKTDLMEEIKNFADTGRPEGMGVFLG